MSEEINNEVETVETEPHEVQLAAIRQMMDQWADGKLTDAQATFNDVMGGRADALVSDKKAEIAATIYNKQITDGPDGEGEEDLRAEFEDTLEADEETPEEDVDTEEDSEEEEEQQEGETDEENV